MMQFRIFLAIFAESLQFAFHSIRANLLRTLLSLLGITIGVFCIISIFTFVDSIEFTIRDSVSRFGSNVIFVQKWPWLFSPDQPWWKYVNRPEISYKDFQQLQKRFPDADGICFNAFVPNNKATKGDNSIEGIFVRAVSPEFENVIKIDFEAGRFFSETESQSGAPVTVIGYELAERLFGNASVAIGQKIGLMNRQMEVVGVFAKEGKGLGIGGDQDRMATVPLNFLRNFGRLDDPNFGPSILVKAKPGISEDDFEDEIRGVMRGIRKLNPRDEDDFALNKITMFTSFLAKLFDKVNLFGWIIAGFSILVGGFGIANIMFVSVKERTSIVGIQKSLGAKNYFILIEFLGEAIILCILGGIIGLLLIWLLTFALGAIFPLKLVLTVKNIFIGLGISSVIGVLSGYIPSRQAARMDPIEAIRFSL